MPELPAMQIDAIKTLVALHGQRKAARIAGISESTVRSWCQRYNWPSLFGPRGKSKKPENKTLQTNHQAEKTFKVLRPERVQSPSDTLVTQVEQWKQESKVNQAAYLAEASAEARAHQAKLEITQEAKHLSEIHRNLFPENNSERGILNLNVLIGDYCPPDSKSP
jgi:transposase